MIYELSQEESKRIDILKFVAMVLVVYIHAQNIGQAGSDVVAKLPNWLYVFENVLSKDIAGMADALFFLISAVLLFRSQKTYKEMLKGKLKTLLLPYVLWNTLWVVIFAVFERIPFTSQYFTNPEYRVSTWGISEFLKYYGVSFSGYPLLYPLWFMRDIMVMMLLSPVIRIVAERFPKMIMTVAVILLFVPISFPYKGAFLFFVIGACIVKLDWHMQKIDDIPGWLVTGIYIILIIGKELTKNVILSGCVNLWGILFFVKLSRMIYQSVGYQQKTWIQRLIGYSFIIYVGHEMFLTILKKISAAVLPQNVAIILAGYLIYPLLLMLICVLVASIIRKKVPKLYSVLTGSR